MNVRYTEVPCPYCGANVTMPCHSARDISFKFTYIHAARRKRWWTQIGNHRRW